MTKRLVLASPVLAVLLAAAVWMPREDVTAYDSARSIEAGLELERRGNIAGAEAKLLEAAKVDREFQPAWTLAGFYFRRGDTEHFWQWARTGLAAGRRDLGALFVLCWQVSDDPEEIWRRAMPERKSTWEEYLFFLMTENRWQAAGGTALRVADIADGDDRALLLNYCDAALEHGEAVAARAVWQVLCRRKLLPYNADALLTNGDFRLPPMNRGFDWIARASGGVSVSFRNGEAAVMFNGFEPDRVVALEQRLALRRDKRYRLEFEAKCGNVAPGLHWEAGSLKSGNFAGGDWTRESFSFSGDVQSLLLVYQKSAGVTTAEGAVAIRNLRIVSE